MLEKGNVAKPLIAATSLKFKLKTTYLNVWVLCVNHKAQNMVFDLKCKSLYRMNVHFTSSSAL